MRRWADVARKSHPNCKIGLVLDQDTQLENADAVDVLHRLTIDKSNFGRNEYNDLYHWQVRGWGERWGAPTSKQDQAHL